MPESWNSFDFKVPETKNKNQDQIMAEFTGVKLPRQDESDKGLMNKAWKWKPNHNS